MTSTPERTVDEKVILTSVTPPSSQLGTTTAIALDEGFKILQDRGDHGGYVLDPVMRRRVLWKIDLHILPILT